MDPELDLMMAEWRRLSDQHDRDYAAARRWADGRTAGLRVHIQLRQLLPSCRAATYTRAIQLRRLREGRRRPAGATTGR